MILGGFHGKWALCAACTLGTGPDRYTSQRTGSWTLSLSEAFQGWLDKNGGRLGRSMRDHRGSQASGEPA